MPGRRELVIAGVAAFLLSGCRKGTAIGPPPSLTADPEGAARDLLTGAKAGRASAVVAVVVPGHPEAVAVQPGPDGADRSSLFEIASITKTMTATALASLVVDGTAGLDDPIGRWIDAGPNAAISLRQLATHRSGLPRLPPSLDSSAPDEDNPYEHYGPGQALTDLRDVARTTERGTYSNFGLMLLGLILERIAQRPFDAVLHDRVFAPLGMRTATTDTRAPDLVTGHDDGRAVPHWHHQLPGAGGVVASIDDLIAYVRAQMAPPVGLVGDAIRLAHGDRLAWVVDAPDVFWHNGGSGGFSSMLAFNRRVGVVGLAAEANVDESSEHQIIEAVHRA